MKNINPVVYDAERKVHAPAPDGSTLMPSLVPLDPASENMLRRTEDGVSITAAEVVSTESGNVIGVGADHKVYVRPGDMVSEADGNLIHTDVQGKLYATIDHGALISDDEQNMLSLGADKKLFVAPTKVRSDEAGNLLEPGADGGVKLTADLLVSDDADNKVVLGKDKKLYVAPTQIVSEEAGNLLEPGADGGVRLTADVLVSNDADNQIVLGKDKKLYVEPTQVVSEDEGNLLVTGNDGGAKLEVTGIVSSQTGNRLQLDDTKKLFVIGISTEAGNLLRTGEDGGIYLDVPMLLSTQGGMNPLGTDPEGKMILNPCMLPQKPNVVSVADGNLIESDRVDGSAYLGFDNFVSDEAGNIIKQDEEGRLIVSADGTLSSDSNNLLSTDAAGAIKLTAEDVITSSECNLLQKGRDGKVELCLGLTYNQINGQLELRDTNNAPVASVVVPSAASMLQSVVLESNPLGQPEGVYLKMGFKLADGSIDTVYVDLTSLEDIYTAGKGIEIKDQIVSLKLSPGSGLAFDEYGNLRADFGGLTGSGLGVEQDPETNGFRYAVQIGRGLDFGTRLVPDPYDATAPYIEVSYIHTKLDQNQSLVFFKEATDGEYEEISAFLGLRANGSGEASYLEFYDHNGAGLSSSRVALGNGLTSDGSAGITIATEKTLTSSDKPISAGAVQSAVAELRDDLIGVGGASDAGLAALNDKLQKEVNDRIAGDTALGARIDALRDELGEDIRGALEAEVAAREAGDKDLSGKVDQLRSDVDDIVNNALAEEIAAREAGDTALQNSINTLDSELDAQVAALTAMFKDWLLRSGGQMLGAIDMNNNELQNVPTITSEGILNLAATTGIQVNGQNRITFGDGTAIWVE